MSVCYKVCLKRGYNSLYLCYIHKAKKGEGEINERRAMRTVLTVSTESKS